MTGVDNDNKVQLGYALFEMLSIETSRRVAPKNGATLMRYTLATVGAGFGDEGETSESEAQPDFLCPSLLQFLGITLSNHAEPPAQEVLFQTVQAR